jgi:exodeoxyribonuclease VII large subunit
LGLPVIEPNAPAAGPRVWSVGALLLAVADALAARFSSCSVQGELSGFTRAASGHCYFTLKDADGAAASVRCAMFRRAAVLVDFTPRDGQQVELRGRIALYEPRGEMQFVVESMRALGAGSLYEQFLRLKAKLEAEGLFDASRKRELPSHAASVGVVTSLAGAALHDVLSTLERRAPHVRVVVYPSLVQGSEAPAALVGMLAQVAARSEVDVLIVARGGGSIEDLWAFNDERVVRAIAALPMPVISGVGHETDITLTDFVADLRAATPTAAAELAAPARDDLLADLGALGERIRRRMRQRLDTEAQRLDQRGWQLARPAALLQRERQRLMGHAARLAQLVALRVARSREALARQAQRWQQGPGLQLLRERSRLETLEGRLVALDPTRVLSRGYALLQERGQGRVIRAPAQLHAGQDLRVTLAEGVAAVRIESAEPE